MIRTAPPFRADHVGSLLRPRELKEARAQRERGEIPQADLTAIEDSAIERAIAKQAEVGLRSATDGEFRRAMWHFDFLERLDGVESFDSDHGIQFKGGIETRAKGLRVNRKDRILRPPDAGPFPFPPGAHARDREDDNPFPQRSSFSWWPPRGAPRYLSRYGRVL